MKLEEAKEILKENKYMILNETTAISAPETRLGMCVMRALEQYKNEIREQIKEGEDSGDEEDVKAGTLLIEKIDMGIDTTEEEELGVAVLKVLGLDDFNPYYPDQSNRA